jgi:hypothetical protein
MWGFLTGTAGVVFVALYLLTIPMLRRLPKQSHGHRGYARSRTWDRQLKISEGIWWRGAELPAQVKRLGTRNEKKQERQSFLDELFFKR